MEYDTAVKVYRRWAEPEGLVPMCPSEDGSYCTRGIWYLHNVNGLLVRVGTRSRRVL